MAFPGDLTQTFPNLTSGNSRKTSEASNDYNCIAWAADDATRFWWPDENGFGYWPEGNNIPREVSLSAFIAAYESIGYAVCDDGKVESAFEKIAIYTKENRPTHAARQLPSGKWTSKLGTYIDIEHASLNDVSGNSYGTVSCFLKRQRSNVE